MSIPQVGDVRRSQGFAVDAAIRRTVTAYGFAYVAECCAEEEPGDR